MRLNNSEKLNKLLSKSVDIAAIQLCNISVKMNTGSHSYILSAQITKGEGIPAEVRNLLECYEDVFSEP